ncbi:HEPN domain-containing protein [Clostridium sp.]|uniref:HEPN domain-containing protein n=1 Tax=Clostridium sp. TaxID=1506 RepID=UPI003F3F3F2E
MVRDAILANTVGVSYPRQLEMVHGAIERILKSFVIKQYGIELLIHETSTIYDAIKLDLGSEISKDNYDALRLLDNNFILYRYPTANRFYNEDMIDMAFEVLININSLVEDALKLSNRAKQVIKDVEKEISISTNID